MPTNELWQWVGSDWAKLSEGVGPEPRANHSAAAYEQANYIFFGADAGDQALADIAAFYASQTGTGGQTDPALLALGEAVFRSGIPERNVAACTACHSPTGKGNAPAGFPSLAGQHAEYIAAQLLAYRKGHEDETGRVNDGDTRIMRITAFGLSDKEIQAVASYASGLR